MYILILFTRGPQDRIAYVATYVTLIKHCIKIRLGFVQDADLRQMSHLVEKPTMWFPTRSDTNQNVQSQKQVRSLKFPI